MTANRPAFKRTLDEGGIIEDCKLGLGLNQICSKRHVSIPTVRRILGEHGLELRYEFLRRKLQEDHDIICERYRAGETLANIAGSYEVNADRISDIIKSNGIEVRRGAESVFLQRKVSLKKLEDNIIREPGFEKRLIPLCLYKGYVPPGRAHRFFNMAVSMMLHEASGAGAATKLINNQEYSQLCLPDKKVQNTQVYSFFSRLRDHPDVTGLVPGLTEYAEFIMPVPFRLQRVSESTFDSKCRVWWRTVLRKQRQPRKFRLPDTKVSDLSYPFLIHEPRREHELLMLVNNAVPRHLPEDIRADVCQDMLVAILSGEMDKGEIEDNVKENVRRVFKMFPTKYGPVSLDSPLSGDDDRTLLDTLSYDEI